MMRPAAAGFAVVAFAVPLLTARPRPLLVIGLIGLLLAALGIALLWRWPVTAAACVFLVDYTAGLWLVATGPGVIGPVVFGLSLLLLLQCVALARATRGATVTIAVIRSQSRAWTGFGAGTLAAAMLLVAAAGGLVATIPFTAAPFLAAVGALGVLLTLAATVRGGWRSVRRSHEA